MSTELRRPRVSAFLALSLDGFIAGEGGDLAWLEPYNGDSQEETGYSALMASADTLLMGRNTYDIVSAFPEWPYGDKPLVVLTHRPADPRPRVAFRQGALVQVLDELWQGGSRHLYLDGGELVRQGLQGALVDELTAAYGLGGRARRTGDRAERARTTVTSRVRDALARIERVHPDLGRHLRASVRTGVFCSYQPERRVAWDVSHVVRPDPTPRG